MIAFTLNGRPASVDVDPDKPLLWVLREDLNVVGPKFGCGVAACGACTVHVDGQAVRSCSLPASAVAGKTVVTIEGLPKADGTLHAVQRAWIENQVPQCGYCQPGFIMATAALLAANPRPTDREVDEALSNLCRCGTYGSIRRAIQRAIALLQAAP
ncbi:MAG: (2Fe-2S)-binding protein [Proteobacteria bacterium]|nr:(2Fe-2S)-binding protein [Pseudomonadota bacterium]